MRPPESEALAEPVPASRPEGGSVPRRRLKRFARSLLAWSQRFGLDVLPRHYYGPVPDLEDLARREDWRAPRCTATLRGFDTEEQLGTLGTWLARAYEVTPIATALHRAAARRAGEAGYGPVEALVLAAFVRSRAPRRIVMVGAGVATAVILDALQSAMPRGPIRPPGAEERDPATDGGPGRDADRVHPRRLPEPPSEGEARTRRRPPSTTEILVVEPYPSPFLRGLAEEGRIVLHATGAERVPLEVLTRLEAGDLLFVDSTHAVRPGSEVSRIVLDVLPRLERGVVVHFHDIHLPYDYSRHVLDSDLFFPAETALLHAFLADNARWRTMVCLSALHYRAKDALRALVPGYAPATDDEGLERRPGHFPSALWVVRDR